MRLSVISDLHIRNPQEPTYGALLKLVREAASGDQVVLAGDIFDLFVGNKKVFVERYADFLKAISEASSRGVQVHYIEGNHDFLLKRALRDVYVHATQVSLEAGGKRFLIVHGDLVNQEDYFYRFMRVMFRSPLMKFLVTALPGSWLDAIGRNSSQYSRGKNPVLPSGMPADRVEHLRKIYRSFAAEKIAQGADYVVAGHCHDLDEMTFSVGGRIGQYINVGFPPLHGSYVTWQPGDEKMRREKFPL